MDPVQKGGPWTRSKRGVHGPGPKGGSTDPGSMFCPLPFLLLLASKQSFELSRLKWELF